MLSFIFHFCDSMDKLMILKSNIAASFAFLFYQRLCVYCNYCDVVLVDARYVNNSIAWLCLAAKQSSYLCGCHS